MRSRLLSFAVLAVLLTASAAAEEVATTTRTYTIQFSTMSDIVDAVQPLLSERGTLSVQPRHNRLTVQDTPEVVSRVSELIAELDRPPPGYRIQIELLRGMATVVPAAQQAEVAVRVRRMFPFVSYVRISSTTVEGQIGVPTSADLGDGYRLTFVARQVMTSSRMPFGMPEMGDRITLEPLVLERVAASDGGTQTTTEILRTSMDISRNQMATVGAGASEDAKSGLVLIVRTPADSGAR